MTDPTPTRAEVEALCATLRYGCNLQQRDGEQAADMIEALRERADAAEAQAHRSSLHAVECAAAANAAETALTAARRAEADGWNDACKQIADMLWLRGQESAAEAVEAFRRAAPTEGEA